MDEWYEGEARTYHAMLENVQRFKKLKENDIVQLKDFVNMLSVLDTTLKSLKREADLGNGFMFQELLR